MRRLAPATALLFLCVSASAEPRKRSDAPPREEVATESRDKVAKESREKAVAESRPEADGPRATTPARPGGKGEVTLTILHVNDGESILLDAGKGLEDYGGAGRLATLFDRLRAEAREGSDAVLALSAGDNYEPGPSLAAWRETGAFHDATVLRHLDLDALTIGNHEFDFGPALFADFVKRFPDDTPFVSSNLDVSRARELAPLARDGRIVRSAVVRVAGVDVGIVGATTPLLPAISTPGAVRVEPPSQAVQAEIDGLQRKGAKIVVLLSHVQGLDEDKRLLSTLRGVDVVVSGGGGELLADPGDALLPGDEKGIAGSYPTWVTDAGGRRVPVVTTPGYYRYVGRLVARFDAAGDLVGVVEEASGPVRVAAESIPGGVRADAKLEAEALKPLRDYTAPLAQSVVATLHVPLDGRRAILRSEESNEANLLTDAMLWSARRVAAERELPAPKVALLNGGSIRHDSRLLRGQRLNALDLLMATPFANELVLLPSIAPSRLRDVLENAVSRVEDADGRFLHVAGLKLTWSPSADRGRRVREVALENGTVLVRDGRVVSEEPVTVVTTDFIHRGGDEHPLDGVEGVPLGSTTHDALSAYLATELKGEVHAADYPPGGEGRIVRLE